MKEFLKLLIAFLIFGVILPVGAGLLLRENKAEDTLKLYIKDEDRCVELTQTDYLIGVTAAEMPASFHKEALKAQAVAARTYYIRKSNKYKDNNPHKDGADVCSDFSHCQAYKDANTLKEQWGDEFKENYKKIKNAVESTDDEVIKFKGDLIDAVFHSTSSGRTQNAEDVWGGKVEYLKSVESAVDEKSPRYKSQKTFTIDELKQKLNINSDGFDVGSIIYNEGNTVESVTICSQSYKGTKIRSLLDLDSACFEIEVKDNYVIFNVKGYGHGVGMSQWGANFLAGDGYTYKQILKKYYTDVEIGRQ